MLPWQSLYAFDKHRTVHGFPNKSGCSEVLGIVSSPGPLKPPRLMYAIKVARPHYTLPGPYGG